jgi:hypothetical protein
MQEDGKSEEERGAGAIWQKFAIQKLRGCLQRHVSKNENKMEKGPGTDRQ